MHSDQDMVTTLSLCDFTRLQVLMSTLTGLRDVMADLTRRKLASAVVMLPTDMSSKTASPGRRVRFRVDNEAVRERRLVWLAGSPQDVDVVSCMEPIGLALLGLRPSQSVCYSDADGKTRRIIVEDVVVDGAVTSNGVDPAKSRTVGVAAFRLSSLSHFLRKSLSKWPLANVPPIFRRIDDKS